MIETPSRNVHFRWDFSLSQCCVKISRTRRRATGSMGMDHMRRRKEHFVTTMEYIETRKIPFQTTMSSRAKFEREILKILSTSFSRNMDRTKVTFQ